MQTRMLKLKLTSGCVRQPSMDIDMDADVDVDADVGAGVVSVDVAYCQPVRRRSSAVVVRSPRSPFTDLSLEQVTP